MAHADWGAVPGPSTHPLNDPLASMSAFPAGLRSQL